MSHETFEGVVKWARVFKPNDFGKYTLQFYPSPEDRKRIKTLGTRLNIHEDDDGSFFYHFRRDHEKGNRLLGPPEVLDAEGEVFTESIGNGSVCRCTLEIYDFNHKEHGAGKGTRLAQVVVVKHIPYQKPDTQVNTPELPVDDPSPTPVAVKRKKPFTG